MLMAAVAVPLKLSLTVFKAFSYSFTNNDKRIKKNQKNQLVYKLINISLRKDYK